MPESKPSLLVLGGVGFIGRNLVTWLVEQAANLEIQLPIRVVDKVLPETAYLTPRQSDAFAKGVEFRQGNLANEASVMKVFSREDGSSFEYVINLAAETKYSQSEEVYQERVYQLSINCGKAAAKHGVKKYIEMSTAQVYEAGKKASSEVADVKPWTLIAKYKLKAEQDLKKISGLNLIIVRPAIVYGSGDTSGITPRLIVGAVYKHLNEEMKLLWTKELRINTVHVEDVSRALWHLLVKGKAGEVYNLSDSGDTDQETINCIIRDIFKISTGFQGTIISNFAKLNLASVTEDVNDKHLGPWSELCKAAGIQNTPLSPYLDQELLYNNSLSVDGSKITAAAHGSFTYNHPKITTEQIKSVLDEFVNANLFPRSAF